MTVQQTENQGVPADTLPLRLAVARHFAGGISAREAGHLVAKSGQTWRNWEDGKHTPPPEMIMYIARQLGVDETWLRDGGPLSSTNSGPRGGGRPRQDSNLRPADYTSPPSDLAKYRERRKTGSRRRFFRRGLEAA